MYAVLHFTSWPLSVNDTSAVHSPCTAPGASEILKSPCPPAPVQVPTYLPAGLAMAREDSSRRKLEIRVSRRMERNTSTTKSTRQSALSIQPARSFVCQKGFPGMD